MVSQLFVLGSSVAEVAACLRACCAAQKPRCPRYVRVSRGAKQVLKYLQRSKRQRRFLIAPPQDGWICLWEVVDYADFADPRIAYWLSTGLRTETMWLDLNEDYNVWAFQHFSLGTLIAQEHQPESYFTSSATDPEEMDSCPWCHDVAEEFNRSAKLPYFLVSLAAVKRMKRLAASIRKVRASIHPG